MAGEAVVYRQPPIEQLAARRGERRDRHAEHLERVRREPLYTTAATMGISERRLAQMSREQILEMLLERDDGVGTS